MEHNGTFGPPVSSPSPTNRLQELILSLDQAAFMARQLPATSDPAHLHQINSVLHHAHHSLSSFLSAPTLPPPPPPPPPPPVAENSVSSATHNGSATAPEPMQVGEDEEESSIDRVEERMRNCFIKNKRPKRPLSPSAAAEDEEERGSGGLAITGFDPHASRLRALDLVYQFHG